MGFLDYVVEYFKGPAGADGAPGATGPTGPAGPGTLHRQDGATLIEDSPISDGTYTSTITIPDGAVLVSATPADMNPITAANGITSWTVTQPFVNKVKVEATVVGAVTSIINVAVLYYLP